jgi:NAD(P)H dehydrogenase (quinone)
MKVLTVYANPNPKSFCHAILEQFDRGLKDAGHEHEIVDLYAIKFNPVLGTKDGPCWVNEGLPMELLEGFNLKKQAELTTNNPLMRMIIRMVLRNKSTKELLEMAKARRPKDVVEQQSKISRAQGLAIIAPSWFVGFPAILKGYIERVFTPGFAYGLSMDGWKGDLGGRIPMLKHDKVLLITTTLFNEKAYKSGLEQSIKRLYDDFAFSYPGIKNVEHKYYYGVNGTDDATRKGYLQNAYLLGKNY